MPTPLKDFGFARQGGVTVRDPFRRSAPGTPDTPKPANVVRIKTDRARTLLDLHVSRCVEQIGSLPEPGESVHAVCADGWHSWALIEAIPRLAGVPVASLHLASLSMSKYSADKLIARLDEGTIGSVTLLLSVYFESHNVELCQGIKTRLADRGHRCKFGLNHAKIAALRMTDNRVFVIEGSGNLRSCSSTENVSLFHDAGLYEFHRAWIDRAVAEDGK